MRESTKQTKKEYRKLKDFMPIEELEHNPNGNIPGDNVMYAYKQFKTLYDPSRPSEERKGRLFPLYVKADTNDKGIEVGKWYRCGQGELYGAFNAETGEPIMDEDGNIQAAVKSKLGKLSFRPGWHLSSAPVTTHIGPKDSLRTVTDDDGNPVLSWNPRKKALVNKTEYGEMYSQNVWALVEFSCEKDVTPLSGANGIREFCDDDYDGAYYHFKTNSSANDDEDWIIANAIKVVKVLTDEEVEDLCKGKGLKAQKRHRPTGKGKNRFSADFSQFEDN